MKKFKLSIIALMTFFVALCIYWAVGLRVEALTLNPLYWRGTHRGDARLDLRGPKGERWLFDVRPFNIDFTAKLGFDGQVAQS